MMWTTRAVRSTNLAALGRRRMHVVATDVAIAALLMLGLGLAACSESVSGDKAVADAANADGIGAGDVGVSDAECKVGAPPPPNAAGCNPLAPEWGDCLLPWPADVYRQGSPARLQVPAAALPVFKATGQPIDFLASHPADGFSRHPTIALRAPGGFSRQGVVGVPLANDAVDPALSALPTHPTLLLDVETGALVPHFVEVDDRADPGQSQALILRPLRPLAFGRRYAVGLLEADAADVGGLRRLDGTPHRAPATFAKLRDGADGSALSCWLESAAFAPLVKAGVARGRLLLAWGFTTEAAAFVQGDLLAMRAAAMASFAASPVPVTVVAIDEPTSGDVGRRVELLLTVPRFVDSDAAGSTIWRDASGHVARNGDAKVPATVWIPRALLNDGAGALPRRALQFGHGFFGDRSEAGGFGVKLGQKHGFVVAAVDWWGMSVPDRKELISGILTNPSNAMGFVDRLHQGMVNQMALTEALRTSLAQLPALQDAGGKPLYDAAQVAFYGISQGHILGSTYVALAPKIDRAVLAVGGVSFGLMMSRAAPFGPFLGMFDLSTEAIDASFDLTLLLQTVLDRVDPVVWVEELLAPTLPGGPSARRVLQHVALGDTSVPNVASHLQARAMGLSQLAPAPRPIYGVPTQVGPIDGSAICAFDFGYGQPDLAARPNIKSNDAHNDQRGLAASMRQVDRFLRPGGKIEATCDGVCDPE